MHASSVGLASALVLAGAATAQPTAWIPVKLSDLRGTADYQFRTGTRDFLSAAGDYDGDGKQDEAMVVQNPRTKRFAVEVRLATGKVHRLAEGPLAGVSRIGVSTASPGEYLTACGKGHGSGPCPRTRIRVRNVAIEVFTFEAAASMHFWTGERFDEEWMSD